MTLNELKIRRMDYNLTDEKLAQLSGVPQSELTRIFTEESYSPDYETIRKLRAVLDPESFVRESFVREPAPQYAARPSGYAAFPIDPNQQGHYTLEDYYRLSRHSRFELINGILFTMDAPSIRHQNIGGFVFAQFFNFIRQRKGPCLPLVSPVDVQLDQDNRTMVQPDVAIVCDRSKIINRCIYGAPDFVLEVTSPSTRLKDLTIKSLKYQESGVREFWIVDQHKKAVLVYQFEHSKQPVQYDLNAKIPVGIWNGELEIDFSEVQEYCALFTT